MSLKEMRASVARISVAAQAEAGEGQGAGMGHSGLVSGPQTPRAAYDQSAPAPEVTDLLNELVKNPSVRSAADPGLVARLEGALDAARSRTGAPSGAAGAGAAEAPEDAAEKEQAAPARPRPLTSARIRRRFARSHAAFSKALAEQTRARREEWLQEMARAAEEAGERFNPASSGEGIPDEWEGDSDDGFVVVPVAADDFLPLHETALTTWRGQRALAMEGRKARRERRRRRRRDRRSRRRSRRTTRLQAQADAAGVGEDVAWMYAALYGSDTEKEEEAEATAVAAPASGRDELGRLMSAAERADISEAPSSDAGSDSPSGSSCLSAAEEEESVRDSGVGNGRADSARKEALDTVRGARGARGFAWESATRVLGAHPLSRGADMSGGKSGLERALRARRARRRRPRRVFCGPRRAAVFDTLALPVVYERNKTGFEEEKDMVPRPGTVIAGRYRVVGFLGEAAFSTAVECEDLTGKGPERVCLKIIQNNKEYMDQSLDEIKLLKYINACGDADEFRVLRLLDYFYHREHLILVSELLRDNLYEYGRFNREHEPAPYFTPERVRGVAFQCFRALAFLHDVNLVHCDLKPENVLIQSYSRAQVKVIDFGSSCFLTDHLTMYIQSRSYRAPEVILGLPYGQKIDVWSLGCILAELITGHVLLQNDSIATMLARAQGILGPIPRRMLREGSEVPKYFTAEFTAFEASEETGEISLVYPKRTTLAHRVRCSDPLLLDFLAYLLQWDPKARPTAKEALHHPWLAAELAAFLRTSPDGLTQSRPGGRSAPAPHVSPQAGARGNGTAQSRPLSPSPRMGFVTDGFDAEDSRSGSETP